jgi:multiple sugar transport system ATP-binding protein
MASLSLSNIEKMYPNGFHAVKGVSLDVADGEFVVLVGPSGCGKSTVLRMIAGLEDVSSGTITIGGRTVNDLEPKDRDIAMVFQNYALYPHMTVRKNMGFALSLAGVPREDVNRRVEAAARSLGIEQLLDRKPGQLSGGQRQRVAVGRAIVRNPKVALFDEPLSNLDAKLRVATRGELKALHQRLRTTTIYVTHDQEEAMTLGDRIAVLKDGVIQQVGSPLEVYNHPANKFVAGFIGMPPMNFLPGTLESAPSTIRFRFGDRTLPVHERHRNPLSTHIDRPVVLGLRPRSIRLHPTEGIPADVRFSEMHGEFTDTALRLSGIDLLARSAVQEGHPAGSNTTLLLNMHEAYWFAADETGSNLLQS